MANPVKPKQPESSAAQPQLESHLWKAAWLLKGPVDAADFKTYIFPLLFFKRLSDVHDEEHEAALKEFAGDEEAALFPENYRFQVPEGCHWRDVRKVAVNVGQALQAALRGIEQANPHTLYGIFGDAHWTNKDRLPDKLLRDLIEHFSALPLGNRAAQADILGQAYEYLIKQVAGRHRAYGAYNVRVAEPPARSWNSEIKPSKVQRLKFAGRHRAYDAHNVRVGGAAHPSLDLETFDLRLSDFQTFDFLTPSARLARGCGRGGGGR
jgi:hypothetical protein